MVSRRPELLTSLLPWNKPHRFDSALCLVLLLCITSLVAVSGSLVRLQDGSLISSHLSRSLPRHGVTFVLAITEVRDVQPPKQSDGAIKQLSNLWYARCRLLLCLATLSALRSLSFHSPTPFMPRALLPLQDIASPGAS